MNINETKKIVEQLLATMKIEAEIEIMEDTNTNLTFFAIQTKEPNVLIGLKGEVLVALSHLLKKMSETKEEDTKISFIVDVNGYQKRRIGEIKDKAVILAERARYYQSSIEMDPASPYERMIVHSIFSQDSQIKTRSTGEGRQRHIVFEYIGE